MIQNVATPQATINPNRLRLGIFLVLLWWIPFWVLAPFINSQHGVGKSSHATSMLTITIMIVQTIIGAIGVYVAGKQASTIIKETPKKQVLPKMWQIIRHGTVSQYT